jgi:hypothetical protein
MWVCDGAGHGGTGCEVINEVYPRDGPRDEVLVPDVSLDDLNRSFKAGEVLWIPRGPIIEYPDSVPLFNK